MSEGKMRWAGWLSTPLPRPRKKRSSPQSKNNTSEAETHHSSRRTRGRQQGQQDGSAFYTTELTPALHKHNNICVLAPTPTTRQRRDEI